MFTKFPATALVGAAVALALPPSAAVAGSPSASTAAATDITATTATLNATVLADKESTSYFFEYGTTTAYGSRTAQAGPVGGNASRAVSAAVTALAPSTTYHVRVTATNASGVAQGSDVEFTTTAAGSGPASPPPSSALTLVASKATVTFGNPVALTGGAGADTQLTLSEQAFPFTGPFADAKRKTKANAAGAFALSVTPERNTRYRVESRTGALSPEVAVDVRVRVGLRLSDTTPRRGQRIRFTGNVTPAHNGTRAKIQRKTATGWKTIATPALVETTALKGVARSTYAKRIRVRATSRYRAVVVPTDGDHVRGRSARRRATVS
jgi:hypothetical protein